MPRCTALLLAALLAPAAAAAQQPAAADSTPRYRVAELVVTATRSEASRHALPQRVDVIGAADLERTPAGEMTELLKRNLAADVVQFPGLLAGIGLRGFRPQYAGLEQRTLLLVDGRPAGATNLALLATADVERIEVLRGPASALYGSNAMGGVINVITRRSAQPLRSSVTLGAGSWQTREAALAAGGALGARFDVDLALALLERGADYRIGSGNVFRGWIGEDSVTKTFGDGSRVRVAERGDGMVRDFSRFGTRTASLRLGYRVADRWRVDVRGERFGADGVQNPGDLFSAQPTPSLKDVARSAGEAGITGEAGRHELRLRGFAATEYGDYYSRPDGDRYVNFRSVARWTGAQAQDVVRLGAHSLTLGADMTRTRAESESFSSGGVRGAPFNPDSEKLSAAGFAQAHVVALDERLAATVGARFDRIRFGVDAAELGFGGRSEANDEVYTVFNPSAGLQLEALPGVRLHTTAGRAFVAPDAFTVAARVERASGAGRVTRTVGNPELQPETSVTWDGGVGLARPRAGFDADVTVFRTRVRDRVTPHFRTPAGLELTERGDTVTGLQTYVNADAASIEGLEWSVGYDLGAHAGAGRSLRVYASGSRLFRAEERIGDAARDIFDVAGTKVVGGIEYDDLHRLAARLQGRFVGERTAMDFSDWTNPAQVGYPRFLTLDASAQLRLAQRYRLGVAVENLTDENHYDVRGYPLPGRALRVQLGAEF